MRIGILGSATAGRGIPESFSWDVLDVGGTPNHAFKMLRS